MNQFKFEWLKALTTKTNYFSLILLLILLIIPMFIMTSNENIESNNVQNLEANIEMEKQAKNNLKDEPEASAVYDSITEAIQLKENAITAYKYGNNTEITKAELNIDKKDLKDTLKGELQGGYSVINLKQRITTKEYLLENDIQRIDPAFNQVPSIHYLYNVFNHIVPFSFIFIVLSLLMCNIYTLDKRKKNIDFLNTVPVSLNQISFSKIFTATGFAIITLLVSLLLTLVINSVIHGVGNFNYPLAYSIDGENVLLMKLTTFISKTVLLSLIFVIFLSALSFLISVFTGSIIVNTVILVSIILVADSSLLEIQILENIAHLLPFSYTDPANVVVYGSEFNPLPNSSVTFKNGMINLGIQSMIIFIIAHYLIWQKKKL